MRILLLLLVMPWWILAQTGLNGTFTNTTSGVTATLKLATKSNVVSGTYTEDTYDLVIQRTASGSNMRAKLKDKATGQSYAPPSNNKSRDAQIVGTWMRQEVINGDGISVANAYYLVFETNGRYAQYSKGVGSGGDWSYSSGDAELIQQGMWYSGDGVLYLKSDGAQEYFAAAKYRIVEGKLITEDVDGKKIWNRQ